VVLFRVLHRKLTRIAAGSDLPASTYRYTQSRPVPLATRDM
jgi:hypothetical protein